MRVVLLALLLSLAAAAAQAQGSGGQTCSISATPLIFGAYRPASAAPDDFTATLTIDCRTTTASAAMVRATIALAGAWETRYLSSGGRRLAYRLYTDPGRHSPWGAGGGTVAISGVATPSVDFRQTVTVYGRLIADQTGARVGEYTDAVTVVLSY